MAVNDTFHLHRGSDANLESIRKAIQNSTSREDALSNTENEEELLFLETDEKFMITWENNDDDDNDQTSNDDANIVDNKIQGKVLITTNRLLFVALSATPEEEEEHSKNHDISSYDVSVDAKCIYLHALASDPISLYIQITESSDNDEDAPKELTLIPCDKSKETCQVVFEQLSQLISRHPIFDEEDDDYHNGEEEFDMDEMIFAPATTSLMEHPVDQNGVSDPTPAEDERQNMLDRLGDMLIVPPQLEIQDGQFDDADEDDDKDESDNLL
mmetsp:Transcript_11150/g.15703  ORF Transcript_11150/g.15703 Transcript_11150/m.15703 type:complete len:271 (+) Transcript_11150:295-1107(+)